MAKALSIYMGKEAAKKIGADGWSAEHFDLLLGASGGPKWLILGHLDRFLFGDFLQRSNRPLSVLGSSIGSWRHACLTMPDPVAAIDKLQEGYLYQRYVGKPSPAEVSAVSCRILETILGENGVSQLLCHPRIQTHVVTARGRGLCSSASTAGFRAGLGAAALNNILSRQRLQSHFQRVVFHTGSPPNPGLNFQDFQTHYCTLQEDNTLQSLHASGAIPLVLAGERNISGAPAGQYWDGGIIDYHFDLSQYCGDGLILYPHFSTEVIRGWFDKFLSRRRTAIRDVKKLVLMCPSTELTADLPLGKIPDRSDFTQLGEEERIHYWEQCAERSRTLAEEFAALLESSNPLAGVTVFD
jgi:hypothetical protein